MALSNERRKKVDIAVTEIEDEILAQRTPHVAPVPSLPDLTTSSIVGSPLSSTNVPSAATTNVQHNPVAPQDAGWTAWLVLCGAILVQGVLFAFPQTFGVFQDYFGRVPRLSNTSQSIWIGVLSTGVPFLGAPFMTAVCEAYPKVKWRYYVLIGWAICCFSLIGAAFSKSVLPLAFTQGGLYGLGLLILDVPVLLILNTWWVKRRGTAYGLLFGITDFIGFGATILADYLLREHTLRGALLTYGFILFIICGPAMWLLKTRPDDAPTAPLVRRGTEELALIPLTRQATSNLCPSITTRYFRRPIFYIFTLTNLFHALAYYLPFIYLPSYTTNLGYTATQGAYVLAGANFSQIFGEIAFGQLSDRLNVHCLVMMCSLVSSVAALALWGFGHSLVRLAWFALVYGTFGSGLISLWARMGTFFSHDDAQMIYSVMSFGRGIGTIVSGPISSALLTTTASRGLKADGSVRYGNGKYLSIVLFVGTSMAVSALMGIFGLVLGWYGDELGGVDRKRKRSLRRQSSQAEKV